MKFSKILDILNPSVPEIVAKRKCWLNTQCYICVILEGAEKKFVQKEITSNFRQIWYPNSNDMFADDWEIVRLKT